uniref:Uncharacterized protein n=1 Tax=Hyaloperonospora arabidopsidis (strain Emoy2) TaxID=559515 RepID=M4BYG9_HYAAE
MPVCTTKLVGDCASADGADGTEGRCAYIEELCLPLNHNGNCTAIDVAQMLHS